MTALLDIVIDAKHYGPRTVLQHLHLQLHAGEILSVIGASGCGKSTMLAIAAGLDRDFHGQVRLDGVVQRGTCADIGFIFQEPRLFPWLTVAQNIAFGAAAGHRSGARIAQLLAEVGLDAHADALPKQLSGGQAQRVAIARGLFMQPRILLLDEPFSAVDAFTRIKLQDLLVRVAGEHALSIMLVTHDVDEALYLSDRIILLDGAAGPPRTVFDIGPYIGPEVGPDSSVETGRIVMCRPRQRSDPALAVHKAAILDKLRAVHAI